MDTGETTAFDRIAAAYDLLLGPERLAREVPAIAERLQLRAGQVVCDLGCGTGDHLAALQTDHGIQGTGVDASTGMIAVAGQRHRDLDWQVGDLRRPPPGPWQALLCIGNVLPCLPVDSDLTEVYRTWAAALAPGGRLLLQMLAPLDPEEARQLVRRQKDRILSKQLLGIPTGALLDLTLHEHTADGWRSSSEHQQLHLRPATDHLDLLAAAGFTDLWHSGDLQGSTPSAQDNTIVISARRPA